MRLGSSVALVAMLALPGALASPACGGRAGASRLHARKAVLEREVKGLRELVGELEQGRPLLPDGHLAVSVHERLVRDILAAALPFEAEVDRFRVRLERAEVSFRARQSQMTLDGAVSARDQAELSGELRVYGGFDALELDAASGMLRATLAVDHIDVVSAAGLERMLSAGTLDELARELRGALKQRLPNIEIPVQLQQRLEIPALTDGPVLIEGAAVPLSVAVSRVVAVSGRLWVSLAVQPGPFEKLARAPEPR